MANKLILSLDQGSSGSRAFALRADGTVAAKEACVLEPRHLPDGRAEYDANELLNSQTGTLNRLIDQLPAEADLYLAVSSQRSTVVLWDKQTGKPLCPVLTWQDGRAQAEAGAVDLPQEEIHKITGLYKTPFYSAAKIAWCLKNIPAAAHAAAEGRLMCGPVASHLIWHLTRGAVFATDVTLAQRMLLLNVHTLDWDETLLALFGIKRAWLPQIRPTAGDYGVYEYGGRHVKIAVCAGDQQAAAYCAGLTPGQSLINYGTGAFFLHNAGAERKLVPGILTSLSVSGPDGACDTLLEGPVNAAGSLFLWLKELGFSFDMGELDRLYAQAKNPVLLLPALGGLGAPYWDFTVSPVMSNFTPQTKKADVLAGAVRGLALLLADIVYYLKKAGVEPGEQIKVSGGLARLNCLLQFQADILQTDLLPYEEKESTVMGAARLAAPAAGIDTKNWPAGLFKPTVEPEFFGVEAQKEYRKWRAFTDWCREMPR